MRAAWRSSILRLRSSERVRTQIYNERGVHPGVWNKVVVIAREDDTHAMLNHALIQSRRRYRT